jgi:hypothetical protein
MRSRALLVPVVALLLLSCSGDDDDAPSAEDAQAVVDAALLDADDLGEGWELTSTTPAGENDDDSSPIDACAPDDQVDANDLAESEDREFTLEGELLPSQLQVSAGATADSDLLAEIHELLADDEFQDCLGDAFQDSVGSQPGAEVTIAEITSESDVVDTDGVTSTQLVMPITIAADGITLELEFRFVVLTTDHIGAAIVVSSADAAVSDEQIEEWATLLSERISE